MKAKIPFLFLLLLSCQGPWSYYPENPENYRGIWVNAYIIAGRPVEEVCFEKMHDLDEVRMPGFAFYEEAEIRIKGTFNGEKDVSFGLYPFYHKPNCFGGPHYLMPEAGENYELEASITWDSAGTKVTSRLSAKTYIPKKFKILKAYDLLGQQFKSGGTIEYLRPPDDMKRAYFIPEYSPDVGAALVSIIFDESVYWGENMMDTFRERFTGEIDTADHAHFGDRKLEYTASNQQMAGSNKQIDSIPLFGMNFPAIGNVKVLFYATTPEYLKYRDTYISGNDDSRVEAVYNIEGGAGIFAGMLVDTFEVNLETSPDVRIFKHFDAQDYYCRTIDEETDVVYWELKRECIEFWDKEIGRIFWKLYYEEVEDYDFYDREYMVKKILSKEQQVTWCEHRDFPILRYPLCGSLMVYYSKTGKKSPVLDREVKKWCEEHKDDPECAVL